MFMCVVNLKSVNKLDLTWKQSFLIVVKSSMILALVDRKGQKLIVEANRWRHDTQHNDTQVNDIQHKGLIRDSDT
jgi:hypothetical protein